MFDSTTSDQLRGQLGALASSLAELDLRIADVDVKSRESVVAARCHFEEVTRIVDPELAITVPTTAPPADSGERPASVLDFVVEDVPSGTPAATSADEDEEQLLIGGPADGARRLLPANQTQWTVEHPPVGKAVYRPHPETPGVAVFSHLAPEDLAPEDPDPT